MEQRGHTVVWPPTLQSEIHLDRLATCDALLAYRLFGPSSEQALRTLSERGVAIVWDNDDDYTSIPEDSSFVRTYGAAQVAEWSDQLLDAAKLAQVVTVPSDALAARYESLGVDRVRTIGNCAFDGIRPRRRHEGLVVGWIAGMEHLVDAQQLGIDDALRRLQADHPAVHVECIGVDLGLSERYRHTANVPFDQLPGRMAGFDIGIAPLASIPFNEARSDIKVKEYAASGVPWLASDFVPYRGLGPENGGELVPDSGWFEALDGLVRSSDKRLQLAKNGRAWAKTQLIGSVADQWEAAFAEAVAAKR